MAREVKKYWKNGKLREHYFKGDLGNYTNFYKEFDENGILKLKFYIVNNMTYGTVFCDSFICTKNTKTINKNGIYIKFNY